jgi:hypothetical protein
MNFAEYVRFLLITLKWKVVSMRTMIIVDICIGTETSQAGKKNEKVRENAKSISTIFGC